MITEVPRLTSAEAARRLAEIGANELPSGETLHWYTALRHQLIDPVMGVLLVALGLTLT
jgi:magnesium-transporting ATPase (P-type)